VGAATFLSCSTPGGTWTSGAPAIATIGGSSGVTAGISAGTANITYTISSGCSSTKPLTVYPQPNPISGYSSVCEGQQIALGDATVPGTFSVSGGAASITTSGLVTGIAAGTAVVTYTESTHFCSITRNIAVNGNPAGFTLNTGGGSTASYCAGTGSGVPMQLSGSQAGVNYQLYVGGSPVGSPISGSGASLNMGYFASSGAYSAVATNASTGCSVNMPGMVTVNVNPVPVVYTVTGGGAFCAGGAGKVVGLSNSSTGTNYQLFIGTTPVGAMVSGSGSPLNFGLQTTAGSYSVIATNPVTTCASTMSGAANIAVNPLPASYAVSGSTTICAGASGTVSLSSSNTGIQYQLYRGTSTAGTPLPGTGGPLSFTGLLQGTYTVVATNTGTTCSQGMSGSATIVVNPLPRQDSVESSGSTYCAGGPGVTITLSNSQPGVNYQLYSGSAAVGFPVPGTGTDISFGFQTAGTYSVTGVNIATGCASNMSNSTTVSVQSAPALFGVTGGGNYCASGSGVAVGLAGSQTGVSYQVYLAGAPVSTPQPGTGGTLAFGNFTAVGTYTVLATNTATGCTCNMTGTATVGVNPLPAVYAVTGGGPFCIGGAGVRIGLSSSSTAAVYELYNGGISTGSVIAGIGAAIDFGLQTNSGNYTVKATNITTGCAQNMGGSANIIVNTLPVAYSVTGGGTYCPGTGPVHIGLFNSNPGITYTLKNSGITEGTASGTGSAIDFGVFTAGGTYLVFATNATTGCSSRMNDSAVITITTPIVPSLSVTSSTSDSICSGTVTHFAAIPVNGGSTPSYTWIVNGVIRGTSNTFSYAAGNGDVIYAQMASSAFCAMPLVVASTPISMTVSPSPVVTGSANICAGASTPFTGPIGCSWNSSTPSVAVVATIGINTGMVVGVSAGTAIVTCTLMGCYSTVPVTVNPLPSVNVAAASSCGGAEILTASGAATYDWSPATGLSCGTCSVTAAKPNTSTTYIVTGSLATGCSDTATVTVNANRISGFISYLGNASDIFKVWLIQFNPSDSSLTAKDSTFTCMASGTPYYEFNNKPAGSYMVKARLLGTIPGASGYIPTYSLSTPHWYEASSVAHTNNADSMHINMVFGTVPAGPGFVGGYISAGAGRGTSSAAVPGMLVYLKDAISNFVITYTYTDEYGQYSFSNIGYGSYIVYPEEYDYTTLPSATFTLSSGADSATGLDFRQYTISRIIRPVSPTAVSQIGATGGSMSIFPNPTNGLLNIRWAGQQAANVNVVITDAVGRVVYKEMLNMTSASGTTQLSLGNVAHGMYLMTVSSDKIYYSWKLQISE